MRIAHQRARQQPGLAGDLKAVADGKHRPASFCVRNDLLHDRAEARDCSGTQIVAVAESAREDDHVRALKIVILVPQIDRFFAEYFGDRVISVVITVGTGEGHDAEFHACTADSISKSSVTGFASSLRHMSVTVSSAAIASYASISRMMYRPTCASFTLWNPSVCRAPFTALPCGSSSPFRGVMCTAMRKFAIRTFLRWVRVVRNCRLLAVARLRPVHADAGVDDDDGTRRQWTRHRCPARVAVGLRHRSPVNHLSAGDRAARTAPSWRCRTGRSRSTPGNKIPCAGTARRRASPPLREYPESR